MKEAQKRIASARQKIAAYESCLARALGVVCARPAVSAADVAPAVDAIGYVIAAPGGAPPAGPVVTISPQTVAYMALAELNLTAPTPGIGPPPSINEWKMAAVGYPLWLWAEGNLDPGSVSSSVAGLSVSLDPRISKVVFAMGDGKSITCHNVSTRWRRSVVPGTESPVCGYRYQQPSLPKGNYTVTARTHWAVNWSINGVSGSIPLVQEASTELPVGELQALVR